MLKRSHEEDPEFLPYVVFNECMGFLKNRKIALAKRLDAVSQRTLRRIRNPHHVLL